MKVAKRFGIVRRTIVGLIAAGFLGGCALCLVPMLSGRLASGSDDFYAALFMAAMLGLVGGILAWVVWDMGRRNRRDADAGDVAIAVMPHLMNLDLDDGGGPD